MHQSDYVGPCYLTGPLRFYSLNSVDLATGRCAVTPVVNKAAQSAIDAFGLTGGVWEYQSISK